MEEWKYGNKEKGNREIGKQGNWEIGKFGNMDIWKFGNMEIWKYGYLEIWKFGNIQTQININLWGKLLEIVCSYLSTC